MIRVSGVVRLPDDPEGIEVVLQIVNDRLVFKRARTSLGDYAVSDVGVTQLSPELFELDIEGERIHFLPSNPQLFASLEFVLHAARRPIEVPKKKRRRHKDQEPTPQRIDERPKHEPQLEPDALPTEHQTPKEREPVQEPAPKPPEAPSAGPLDQQAAEEIEVDLNEELVASRRSNRFAARTKYLGAATRDQLRQTGIWPLDRLKALRDEDSLPEEHEHTYLAVTTHAGLIRRVCTECGHVSLALAEDDPTVES